MILVIDNYDSFTYNLVQRLGEIDPALPVEVVRNDRISAAQVADMRPRGVVISPGPCTPLESGVSIDIVRSLAGRVPILGVCLGHQCLGAAHGMSVARHTTPVHGKASLIHHDGRGLFEGLPSPFQAARYHSLVVLEDSVPPVDATDGGWEISAWTDEAPDRPGTRPRRVVMGLRRVWPPNAGAPAPAMLEGVQFHPESFLTPLGPALLANFLRACGGASKGR